MTVNGQRNTFLEHEDRNQRAEASHPGRRLIKLASSGAFCAGTVERASLVFQLFSRLHRLRGIRNFGAQPAAALCLASAIFYLSMCLKDFIACRRNSEKCSYVFKNVGL